NHAAKITVRNFHSSGPSPAAAFERREFRGDSVTSQIQAPQQRRWPLKRVADIPVFAAQANIQPVAKFGIRLEWPGEFSGNAPLLRVPAIHGNEIDGLMPQIVKFRRNGQERQLAKE